MQFFHPTWVHFVAAKKKFSVEIEVNWALTCCAERGRLRATEAANRADNIDIFNLF